MAKKTRVEKDALGNVAKAYTTAQYTNRHDIESYTPEVLTFYADGTLARRETYIAQSRGSKGQKSILPSTTITYWPNGNIKTYESKSYKSGSNSTKKETSRSYDEWENKTGEDKWQAKSSEQKAQEKAQVDYNTQMTTSMQGMKWSDLSGEQKTFLSAKDTNPITYATIAPPVAPKQAPMSVPGTSQMIGGQSYMNAPMSQPGVTKLASQSKQVSMPSWTKPKKPLFGLGSDPLGWMSQ